MFRLAIIAVLGLVWGEAQGSQSPPIFQVLAVIPHGKSPPLVDLTHAARPPLIPQEDLTASGSQFYPTFDEYDDFRAKRDSDGRYPDAYLKPPSEDVSTPLWQDGNNWDLGYDPSDILSPPMPLSMGIPYDTIKYSSDDTRALDLNEQGSSPLRLETRPTKPRQQQKPRPYKKRAPPPPSFSSPTFSDYEERPFPKRHNKYSDYDDAPVRSKKQTYRGYQENFNDYDEFANRPQAAFSFSQTDQHGHYKWGVRHHQ